MTADTSRRGQTTLQERETDMELTYDKAEATVLETTEIGYTIASQDRLWTVFIFDLWSEDEFRYNRLFSTGVGGVWSYDAWGDVLFWTTRREAETFAEELREYMATANKTTNPVPDVYVMNWGDDTRYEALTIGGLHRAQTRTTPRFKGSERAWAAMSQMSRESRESRSDAAGAILDKWVQLGGSFTQVSPEERTLLAEEPEKYP